MANINFGLIFDLVKKLQVPSYGIPGIFKNAIYCKYIL